VIDPYVSKRFAADIPHNAGKMDGLREH
jgi:hypothetical protein